jgi:prepilin signal peptidase PulO-like enzyme (type II secretory pathway)
VGDVKLMLLLGAALGVAARRRAIAFGPFLSFGAVVIILMLAP